MRAILAATLAVALACPAAAEGTRSHGLSAFGELAYPTDFTHFAYVNPQAPVGGTWSGQSNLALGTFDSFNAYILRGAPAYGMILGDGGSLVYDQLMVRALDEPDAVYGLVAEWAEVPEDRSSVTFGMRPEAMFSDGTPVTAHDVVFTLTVLKEKGAIGYRAALADVTGAVALDDHTVRFDFAEGAPVRDLPMRVATLPILSAAWWEGREFDESSLDIPVGSGPYTIGDFEAGRYVSYRRRDDYWAWGLPVVVGHWNFDEIRVEYFRDRSAGFDAFKAGAFLFHEEFTSKTWATEYDFPAVEDGRVVREVLPDGRPSGTQGYWMNLRRPQFADPRVREAIAMVFDFEWSNRTLFYGLYERTDSFFEGGPMEAEGEPSEAELEILLPIEDLLPEGVLTDPAWVPPVSDGSGRMRRQLRAAGRLLDEAGWTIRDGLRRNAAGETLAMEFVDDSIAFDRITQPFIANLRLLGIDATARTVDQAQMKRLTDEYDFDITVARFSMSPTPGVELRSQFHSSTAGQSGGRNLAGIAHPAVDALVDRIIAAESREELTAATMALDRVLRALHPWVPHWNKGSYTVAYWDVFGHTETPPYGRAVLSTWWIDPEKAARIRIGGN